METIYYFDMDETLFTHGDRVTISVLGPNNHVRHLTNVEFNDHVLLPGERYDWQDFRSSRRFEASARPIAPVIDLLKRLALKAKVEILTARADFDDKEHFGNVLARYGIDFNKILVCRAGNIPGDTSAEKKAIHVSDEINRFGYKNVHLYDDSIANLVAFLALKEKHPQVHFYAHHVAHQDGTVRIKRHKTC